MFTKEDWEEARKSWERDLEQFEEELFPIFAARGYTKNVALQVFYLSMISNILNDNIMVVEDEEEEEERWKM